MNFGDMSCGSSRCPRGVVVEVVAELRADDEVAALGEERLQHRFAAAIAVGVGGVDVVDAEVEAGTDQVAGLLVGVVAPPPGGEGPSSEAELRNAEVGAVKVAIAHRGIVAKRIYDGGLDGMPGSNVIVP